MHWGEVCVWGSVLALFIYSCVCVCACLAELGQRETKATESEGEIESVSHSRRSSSLEPLSKKKREWRRVRPREIDVSPFIPNGMGAKHDTGY